MSKKIATSPAPPSSSLFHRGHLVGFALILAGTVALFVAGTRFYRGKIDEFQVSRDRYAAERALDDLKKNDWEGAKREVALLATEAPIGITEGFFFRRPFSEVEEGPVGRNRVMVYERLTAALFDAGLLPEAETVGWKAVQEYHLASRTIEELIPWNLMYHLKIARGDWTPAFESAKILAAHGVDDIKKPAELLPIPYPVKPSAFGGNEAAVPQPMAKALKNYYEATNAQEFQVAAATLGGAAGSAGNPVIKRRLRDMQHRALVEAGDRPGERRLLKELWGLDPEIMDPFWREWPTVRQVMNLSDRDPTLMEYLWRDRLSTTSVNLTSFVDSFSGVDARVDIEDLSRITEFQTGFFQPNNKLMKLKDEVLFFQSVGGRLEIELSQPVRRIYLAYSAKVALGVYPILLMKIDERPFIPLYCDSGEPALLPIDVEILPGKHRIEFIYLNDSAFVWRPKGINENRDLSLYRMVLVHAAPRD